MGAWMQEGRDGVWTDGWMDGRAWIDGWVERCMKEQVQCAVHCRTQVGVCEVSLYSSFNCAVYLKI